MSGDPSYSPRAGWPDDNVWWHVAWRTVESPNINLQSKPVYLKVELECENVAFSPETGRLNWL